MSSIIPTSRRTAFVVLAVVTLAGCRQGGSLVEDERALMGTRFAIRAVHDDPAAARRAIAEAFGELARLEALLSEWQETSEISEVNRRAGGPPVEVGPELLEVVRRGLDISVKTEGAFDLTFAACKDLWSFRRARVPDGEEVAACLKNVDYRAIEVGETTLRLPRPAMKIGIAGIGKGYGVDRAAEVLDRRGIAHYIVDGGGDIRVRGDNRGRPWNVGIRHPRRPGLYGAVTPGDGAIVTSGDYFQFFESGGQRYHHILDPRTGRPATDSIAVTVVAPTATEADAWATGLFVLGPTRGLALVESIEGLEALFFDTDQSVHVSSGFPTVAGAGAE